MSVALLEQGRVASGATGYTTAKLTVGHGLVYANLIDTWDVEVARRYARSNQDAIDRVSAIVREYELDCDLEGTSNFVYAETFASAARLEREAEAARAAGVEATLTSETDLPYAVAAALRVDQQAQFHRGSTLPRWRGWSTVTAATSSSPRARRTCAATARRAWSRRRTGACAPRTSSSPRSSPSSTAASFSRRRIPRSRTRSRRPSTRSGRRTGCT